MSANSTTSNVKTKLHQDKICQYTLKLKTENKDPAKSGLFSMKVKC